MKKTKLWFITRSYLPDSYGGTIIRSAQVKCLKAFFDVNVVTPSDRSNRLQIEDNVHRVPLFEPFPPKRQILSCLRFPSKIYSLMERVGILEDYLDPWVQIAKKYLKDRVSRNDILFSTSGGELGCIKLGSILKHECNCSFIINFHDPLNYSIVGGMKRDKKYHVSREKAEYKYLSNSDAIITSSGAYAEELRNKFPQLSARIFNNYFGYHVKAKLKTKDEPNNKLRIVYGGLFSATQSPELLAKTASLMNNTEVYFIGNFSKYEPIRKYLNHPSMHFIPYLEHDKYLGFISDNIDVGFLSLRSDYFGYCVPSKLYDYINMGLPTLGALPCGDAKDLINNNQYGIACYYKDLEGLKQSLSVFLDPIHYRMFRENIIKDREKWSMDKRIKEVVNIINATLNRQTNYTEMAS